MKIRHCEDELILSCLRGRQALLQLADNYVSWAHYASAGKYPYFFSALSHLGALRLTVNAS